MIFTQYGEPVRIVSYGMSEDELTVRIQSIDDPKWIRQHDISRLRADGGAAEIEAAIRSET